LREEPKNRSPQAINVAVMKLQPNCEVFVVLLSVKDAQAAHESPLARL